MSVILAYTMFILMMAAPFIICALLVNGVVTGGVLLWRGVATGNALTATLGGVLLVGCAVGMALGWRWANRGSAGEAVIERLASLTPEMRARPRRFTLSMTSAAGEVLDTLGERIERVEGTRRWSGAATRRLPGQTPEQYAAWLGERVVVTRDADGAIRLDPLDPLDPAAAGGGVFGITGTHSPTRPNFDLYYHRDRATTVLMRCSLELQMPPILSVLPWGPAMFVGSDTYRAGMARLRACRRQMLERLAAELG